MRLLKITPEGEFSYVETSRENFLETCHREIGCTCIEMPPLMNLPKRYMMIVDESGLLKEEPKVNMLPWFWYSDFNEMAPIVGTVLVGTVVLTEPYYERDIGGLNEDDVEYFNEWELSAKAALYKEI